MLVGVVADRLNALMSAVARITAAGSLSRLAAGLVIALLIRAEP